MPPGGMGQKTRKVKAWVEIKDSLLGKAEDVLVEAK